MNEFKGTRYNVMMKVLLIITYQFILNFVLKTSFLVSNTFLRSTKVTLKVKTQQSAYKIKLTTYCRSRLCRHSSVGWWWINISYSIFSIYISVRWEKNKVTIYTYVTIDFAQVRKTTPQCYFYFSFILPWNFQFSLEGLLQTQIVWKWRQNYFDNDLNLDRGTVRDNTSASWHHSHRPFLCLKGCTIWFLRDVISNWQQDSIVRLFRYFW